MKIPKWLAIIFIVLLSFLIFIETINLLNFLLLIQNKSQGLAINPLFTVVETGAEIITHLLIIFLIYLGMKKSISIVRR